MKSFLESVAEHLIEHYPDRISKVCIVLSNRRASLFLKKHLAKLQGKTTWAPNVFSIEDFVAELSNFQSINSLKTTFELFEVHKVIEGKNAQSFDEFYKWGSILVQDFNELDLHLVDAENLYNYLSEVKSLAEWNLEIEDLSSFQTNYLKFFKSIKKYYQLLNERLSERKIAYNGKLFRSVAENIDESAKTLEWEQVIFAGFNALSLAEEKILFSLREFKMAEFLWDVDDYYLHHTSAGVKHEAGLFFRRYFKNSKKENIKWIGNNLKTDKKEIQIFGVPKQIGQAKFCGQLLQNDKEILASKQNSAIILADENLLIPVLNSIPSEYAELNVTMGLPLSTSPLFSFFNQLFKLQIYSENKKKTLSQTEFQYRYIDILKCLRHSVVNNLIDQLFEHAEVSPKDTLKELKKSGQNNFTLNEIKKAFSSHGQDVKFIALIFANWNDEPAKAIQNFQQLIEILRDATINRQKTDNIDLKMELELLYQFSILINKIANYLSEYGSINTIKILHSIFLQICNIQKLPLYGEPLKGLQLMGMLESRNLDFDNLIILSVNENILPTTGKQNSFIPFELKREFNIPTYREKNAIFAYHFFRLIQRAKNVNIIYNSQADLLAGGDKSRFIHQIVNELKVYNSNINIFEKSIVSTVKLKANAPISIRKTKETFDKLDEFAAKGISASSLNTYIKCPLQFYFKKIARLGEPKEDNETIDAATLGTVIHEALKKFYEPFKGKILNSDELKIKLKNANQFIAEAFKQHCNDGNLKHGKNLLIVHVAQELFKNFIQYEIKELSKGDVVKQQKSISALEEKYTATLKLEINGEIKHLKFLGFIDRLQTSNQLIEVIDYKTGAVKPQDLNLKSWDDLITNKKFDKVFQLLLYVWIFSHFKENHHGIISGIYPLKRISSGLLKVKTPEQKNNVLSNSDLKEFEFQLSNLMIELFDPKINFEQTSDLTTCKYCTYNTLCNK